MAEKLSEALIWKSKEKEIKINSLKELLSALIDIKQEDIKEINHNLPKLSNWLETNFPRQLDLIADIRESSKEFTPQQIRELIIRKLRKII